jgi:thiol-disulfide isomerase/thioredoxin
VKIGKMTKVTISIFIFAAFMAHVPSGQANASQGTGGLPAFDLSAPKSDSEKAYLGLTGSRSFTLEQIKSQVVIMELYSFYCPHCQRIAPIVEEVYKIIQNRPDLVDKIKIIGIAAGDRQFEVNSFKKKFNLSFPLFADPDMEIAGKLGVRATPYFVVVKRNEKGTMEKFYVYPGPVENASQFIAEIVSRAGIK